MTLIENDQTDVIDQGGIAPKREVELLRCGDDDLAGAQGILVTRRKTAGAVQRGDTESEGREGLAEEAFGLGRQRAQRRDNQYPTRR